MNILFYKVVYYNVIHLLVTAKRFTFYLQNKQGEFFHNLSIISLVIIHYLISLNSVKKSFKKVKN